jgi:alpha-tubulin suppressor-like RCC1 family protein
MLKLSTSQVKTRFLTCLLVASAVLSARAQASFVPRIAAGYSHSLSLTTAGTVRTQGENRGGEIGDGTKATRLSPVYLPPPSGQSWARVATGDFRSTALTTAGDMYSWGSNGYGQLGDGTRTDHPTPFQVDAPAGSKWAGVAAGFGHTLALTADGSLYTWGYNSDGQLGSSSLANSLGHRRILSASGRPWTQVAAGYNFSLALCADGLLYTWGGNQEGQLGDGTKTNLPAPVALAPPAGQSWTQLAGGFWSSAALCSDGSLYTWGNNFYGQLGNGTTTGQLAPVRVAPPAGQRWLQVSIGYAHMLATCSDGSLYSWGDGYYGQLGNGTNNRRLTPTRVAPPAGTQWVQVAAGMYHSLALASDGQLYTTGYNYSGQLGDGSRESQNCFTRTCTTLAARPAAATTLAVAAPNPFLEQLQLTISPQAVGPIAVALYNTLGQCLLSQQYRATSGTLTIQQLASLPAGIYSLRVTTSQGSQLLKLVH